MVLCVSDPFLGNIFFSLSGLHRGTNAELGHKQREAIGIQGFPLPLATNFPLLESANA